MLLPARCHHGRAQLVFGHSRYHLPLVPILALYAAALWTRAPMVIAPATARAGRRRRIGRVARVIWGRQVLVVDAARIQGFFASCR